MIEVIGEQVEVAMIYSKNKDRTWPCFVYWRNKKWRMSEEGFKHYVKRGKILVHVYELVTEGDYWMRLEHDTLLNTWSLVAVSDGQAE